MCGEDAVVDDELDVGVGAQGGDGGGLVAGAGGGLDDADADGIVVADDADTGDAGAGPGVRGDGVVAVGDEITVRDGCSDGAGELLGVCAQAGGENHGGEKECGENEENAEDGEQTQGAECGVGGSGMEWGEDGRPRRTGTLAWESC